MDTSLWLAPIEAQVCKNSSSLHPTGRAGTAAGALLTLVTEADGLAEETSPTFDTSLIGLPPVGAKGTGVAR